MQLVIDIPEHYYENNIKRELPICLTEEQVVAILPKGHGRLIDADALANEIPIDVCDGFEVTNIIEATPTIIEADMRGE